MANYQTKCTILSDLFINYREQKEFAEFIEYNDIGLPLAYALAEGLVSEITPEGQLYINETFNLFIAALEIEETEIEDGLSLEGLLDMAEKRQQ